MREGGVEMRVVEGRSRLNKNKKHEPFLSGLELVEGLDKSHAEEQ